MRTLLIALGIALVTGCASIKSGSDPLIVRVEQTQTASLATMDFVVYMDHANRVFWRTNAPAFHNFAEWLRTPQTYGTAEVPRAVAIQLNVDDLKAAYKASKSTGTSNALWSAWSVLNAAILQSQAWSNIVTSPIHP